jgi:hypothetical protein
VELSSKTIIAAPLNVVYDLVKNDLAKIVPYLPNVERIEVLEKAQEGNKTNIVNKWFAKADMPSAVKRFVKPEIFSWKDTAVWDDEATEVKYSLESFLANDLFDAHGHNTFRAIGENETEFTVNCSVKIYPEKVPGVPRLLARTVSPVIETLVEKLLGPNLSSLGTGINDYLKNS